MNIRTLFGFALLIPLLSTLPAAHAQTADPMYDSEGQPYGRSYYKKNAPGLNVALIRQPELGPEFFILRLSSTENYTGCPEMSAIPFEVKFNGNIMAVKTGKYTVDLRNMTNAPQYACNTRSKVPAAEIPLNRDELKSRGIKAIRLESDGGARSYGVELTDTKIRLVPGDQAMPGESYYRDQKIAGRRSGLTYWFYPADTIILSVPSAKPGEQIEPALDTLAAQKGYAPLETVYPDFRSPLASGADRYYVREKKEPAKKSGKQKSKKKKDMTPVEPAFTAGPFGNITVQRAVYRLDQDYDQPVALPVVARKPASND